MLERANTPAMQRTLLARDDLAWLPPSYKAIHWTVAGTIWTGLLGVAAATVVAAKFNIYFFGKGIAMLGVGGYYAGDRAARAVLRSRLARLAHGKVDLAHLKSTSDGELVHVRGKVRARTTLAPLLDGEDVVYRRAALRIGDARLVHEAAVDFQIVGETGEIAWVEVAGAHLVAAEPPIARIADDGAEAERVLALEMPPSMASALATRAQRLARGKRASELRVGEVTIRDGDMVEVVGFKSEVVDPTVERMERETPMRATLRGGVNLPLLIALGPTL